MPSLEPSARSQLPRDGWSRSLRDDDLESSSSGDDEPASPQAGSKGGGTDSEGWTSTWGGAGSDVYDIGLVDEPAGLRFVDTPWTRAKRAAADRDGGKGSAGLTSSASEAAPSRKRPAKAVSKSFSAAPKTDSKQPVRPTAPAKPAAFSPPHQPSQPSLARKPAQPARPLAPASPASPSPPQPALALKPKDASRVVERFGGSATAGKAHKTVQQSQEPQLDEKHETEPGPALKKKRVQEITLDEDEDDEDSSAAGSLFSPRQSRSDGTVPTSPLPAPRQQHEPSRPCSELDIRSDSPLVVSSTAKPLVSAEHGQPQPKKPSFPPIKPSLHPSRQPVKPVPHPSPASLNAYNSSGPSFSQLSSRPPPYLDPSLRPQAVEAGPSQASLASPLQQTEQPNTPRQPAVSRAGGPAPSVAFSAPKEGQLSQTRTQLNALPSAAKPTSLLRPPPSQAFPSTSNSTTSHEAGPSHLSRPSQSSQPPRPPPLGVAPHPTFSSATALDTAAAPHQPLTSSARKLERFRRPGAFPPAPATAATSVVAEGSSLASNPSTSRSRRSPAPSLSAAARSAPQSGLAHTPAQPMGRFTLPGIAPSTAPTSKKSAFRPLESTSSFISRTAGGSSSSRAVPRAAGSERPGASLEPVRREKVVLGAAVRSVRPVTLDPVSAGFSASLPGGTGGTARKKQRVGGGGGFVPIVQARTAASRQDGEESDEARLRRLYRSVG
ncbi:hypothetical protein JCM10213_000668 [Rhodosporidiobolus nylandii]